MMSTPNEFTTKNGLIFVVRLATPADAEPLATARQAAIDERSDFLISRPEDAPASVEQQRAWIEAMLKAGNSALFVAERGGEMLGWAMLRGGDRQRTRHTGTLGITVVKSWRGRGVGTALMKVLLDWAAENPIVEKVKLGVVASNEQALRLYRKLGFVEEGWQPREYKKENGDYLDNVLMYRLVG